MQQVLKQHTCLGMTMPMSQGCFRFIIGTFSKPYLRKIFNKIFSLTMYTTTRIVISRKTIVVSCIVKEKILIEYFTEIRFAEVFR